VQGREVIDPTLPFRKVVPQLQARTQTHFFIIRKQLTGTGTENTWIVLISLSGNRLPDFCPAAALELRDPWWQAFLSYASQVLASRNPSLVDGPSSAGQTPHRNIEVLNDTADLYRYFDCTDTAEFLYACVQRTVQFDLPREIDFLRRHG
jgi:hypothetical protein